MKQHEEVTSLSEMYKLEQKTTKTFKKEVIKDDSQRLLELVKQSYEIAKEINSILDASNPALVRELTNTSNDLHHFLEIESDKLSDHSILRINSQLDTVMRKRRIAKNIEASKKALDFYKPLEEVIENTLTNVEHLLDNASKTYSIRNIDSLNLLKEILDNEQELEGKYNTSQVQLPIIALIKENIKEENGFIERESPLPKTDFGANTLEKTDKRKQNTVSNQTVIPKDIGGHNLSEIIALTTSNPVEVVQKKALDSRAVAKAMRNIRHSKKRRAK